MMSYGKNNSDFFVNKSGMMYFSSPMLSDAAITQRFLKCLSEVLKTTSQAEVADIIGTHSPYLTTLKSSKEGKLPSLMIARFCEMYGYSPAYILTGKGDKRGGVPPTKEEQKEIAYLDIIQSLVNALVSGNLDSDTRKLAKAALMKRQ